MCQTQHDIGTVFAILTLKSPESIIISGVCVLTIYCCAWLGLPNHDKEQLDHHYTTRKGKKIAERASRIWLICWKVKSRGKLCAIVPPPKPWTNYTLQYTRTMFTQIVNKYECECKHMHLHGGETALYTIQKENGKQISLCKKKNMLHFVQRKLQSKSDIILSLCV